jgi:toxin ParE1/3/4
MSYAVVFTPEADRQLESIRAYVASHAGFDIAIGFATSTHDACMRLRFSPFRGTARDELRPGLRTVGFRRRVTTDFKVLDREVKAIGVFYGGQDMEAALGSKRHGD